NDAFKSMLDNIAAMITQRIAERWVEQLFGQQGTTGGGSAGGWISTLMGAFFGGAKAGGGDVLGSRAYLVGEQGPEMFVPRTSGAIIPAAKTEAMMSGRGGGGSITQDRK